MKFRANKIKILDDKIAFLVHKEDLLQVERLKKYTEKDVLAIEVKKWRPVRTLKQNAFEHLLYDYIAHETWMDAANVKAGIKQKYGPWIKVFDEFIPRPSHLCTVEDIGERIEGCFIEMGELGIDTIEFIREWQAIREHNASQKNK